MNKDLIKNSPSIGEYAYEEIKRLIQEGTYPPGAKLVTQDIANQMGISRTPVVVAVNRLAAEGYATAIPQQGIFVKRYSAKFIRDTLELRLMIELFSVDAAIKTLAFDTAAVLELRDAAAGYRDIGPTDYEKAMKVESNFHNILISLSENAEILRAYQQFHCVETTYQMYRLSKMELHAVQDAYKEHEQLVDLLEARDQTGVKALLEKHIRIPLDMLDWLVKSGRFSE